MKHIVIFIVESTAISALLYALYVAFFRGKASYVAQRVLLLLIPFVATLSALVSFDIVELRGVVGGAMVDVSEVIAQDEVGEYEQKITSQAIPEGEFRVVRSTQHHWFRGLSGGDVAVGVWCVVAVILFGLFLRGVNDILTLRGLATKEQGEEYSIYRLAVGSTPFSFWRGIYIGNNLVGNKLDFVLCHEAGHIRRLHYIQTTVRDVGYIVVVQPNHEDHTSRALFDSRI